MRKYYSFTYKVNIGLYAFYGEGCYTNELDYFDTPSVTKHLYIRYRGHDATVTSYKEITKEEFNVLLRM